MLDKKERELIKELIKREVVPAIGCTEPAAVSLCVARASELLGTLPEKIEVLLSANILKNAMGVGIPATGMIGLPIAVALGALVGRSQYGLEVLRDVDPQSVEKGKEYIAQKRISIKLKEDIEEKLYIETLVTAGDKSAKAIIACNHTNFVYLEENDKVIMDKRTKSSEDDDCQEVPLTLNKVYQYATESPIEELMFILEARRLNMAVAETSLKGNYGLSLGRTIESESSQHIMGESQLSKILAYTSAACDARMGGAMLTVMSNSGSGNQGIASTLPVVVYGQANGANDEQMARALIMSHLTVIYIKQSLGRLSALCGCVVAATGSSCGIVYLMGGKYRQMTYAVKNMIANLTGVICDGAKPSCSLKLTTGVSTAVLSAIMAINGHCVTSLEGIIEDDVDRSIANLTRIGRDGMSETDRLILSIMTNKC